MLKEKEVQNQKVPSNCGISAFFRRIKEWKNYRIAASSANVKELELLAKSNGKVAIKAQVKLCEIELSQFYGDYCRLMYLVQLLRPGSFKPSTYAHYCDEANSLLKKLRGEALDGKLRQKLLAAEINGESMLDYLKRIGVSSSKVSKALLLLDSSSIQRELSDASAVLDENQTEWDKFVGAYIGGVRTLHRSQEGW